MLFLSFSRFRLSIKSSLTPSTVIWFLLRFRITAFLCHKLHQWSWNCAVVRCFNAINLRQFWHETGIGLESEPTLGISSQLKFWSFVEKGIKHHQESMSHQLFPFAFLFCTPEHYFQSSSTREPNGIDFLQRFSHDSSLIDFSSPSFLLDVTWIGHTTWASFQSKLLNNQFLNGW